MRRHRNGVPCRVVEIRIGGCIVKAVAIGDQRNFQSPFRLSVGASVASQARGRLRRPLPGEKSSR